LLPSSVYHAGFGAFQKTTEIQSSIVRSQHPISHLVHLELTVCGSIEGSGRQREHGAFNATFERFDICVHRAVEALLASGVTWKPTPHSRVKLVIMFSSVVTPLVRPQTIEIIWS